MHEAIINQALEQYDLGRIINEPKLYFTGDLNIAYKLQTDREMLFAKIISITNYQMNYFYDENALLHALEFAERIALEMLNNGIPTIVAYRNGNNLPYVKIKNHLILFYPFLTMKQYLSTDINNKKLQNIANILGKIHTIRLPDFEDHAAMDKLENTILLFKKMKDEQAWNKLKTLDTPLNLNILYESISDYITMNCNMMDEAIRHAKDLIITHNDIKPKNILWDNDEPILVDWETAGYMPIGVDYLDTVLCWCLELDRDSVYHLNNEKLKVFNKAYHKLINQLSLNEYDICVFIAKWIGWLTYCVNEYEFNKNRNMLTSIREVLQLIKFAKKSQSLLYSINKI